jgi:hypothetical protein
LKTSENFFPDVSLNKVDLLKNQPALMKAWRRNLMSSVDPTVDCDSLPLVFFSQYCLHSTLMSLSSDFVLIEFFLLARWILFVAVVVVRWWRWWP